MSNQNNNNQGQNNRKMDWKVYVSLFLYALLGLAIGYAVAKGVLYLVNRPSIEKVKVVDTAKVGTKDFTGSVNSIFEGDNKADINFKVNSNLTVTQGVGAKSKYFYITDAAGANVATAYMSYEGGRGYSAADYIAEVIAKYVPSVSTPATATYGSSSWLYTASASSEWHVAPAKDGNWLIVLENKKANHDALTSIYETLNIK